jgi:hypothetical protein
VSGFGTRRLQKEEEKQTLIAMLTLQNEEGCYSA